MPSFTPVVFYRDPLAALKWLEAAFGFETTLLVTDDKGRVGHAEMSFGDGHIGVGEEWNDTTQTWQSVDWKTAGYWASLRAATPLAVRCPNNNHHNAGGEDHRLRNPWVHC